MYIDLDKLCVPLGSSILDAVQRMTLNRLGIVLVVDQEKKLLGTITDGDIRRTILANIALTGTVAILLENKANTPHSKPLTGKAGESGKHYLQLLKTHQLLQLPLVDDRNRVVGLVTMDEFVDPVDIRLQAVVMAGGRGARLNPLTEDIPKPMLTVGEKPLLEIIIAQLRSAGIRNVNITTHHKSEKISDHFGNGQNFDVNLSYVPEETPLGTAGAIGLMKMPKDPLLVINGDILTKVDFKAILQFHREHQADLTVGVRVYDFKVPYGVVECDGAKVVGLAEKPSYSFLVNAGIYLLEPHVHQFIPQGQHYNMTDLIQSLLERGCNVVSFPIHEYWLDIGSHAEYRTAQEDAVYFHPEQK
ncbi:MAG: nucleotidyltransferase family protein [Deltaproteobacteria bacterium]|nr:nucleotidyltransferase family protein [Deltaproteobacteria bacterium]